MPIRRAATHVARFSAKLGVRDEVLAVILGYRESPGIDYRDAALPGRLIGVSTRVDARLAVSSALVIAALLTSTSCLRAQLPTASARLHWASIDLPRASYCWNSGGQGECADSADADELLKSGYLKPYRTAGGFDVKITFHASSQPKTFDVQQIQSPDGKPVRVPETTPNTFSIGMSPPAAPGLYVYLVTGTWAEGDVGFFLALDLIPGAA
jgi:hypothetical protein